MKDLAIMFAAVLAVLSGCWDDLDDLGQLLAVLVAILLLLWAALVLGMGVAGFYGAKP